MIILFIILFFLLLHMLLGKVPSSGFLFQKYFQTLYVQPACRSVVLHIGHGRAIVAQVFPYFATNIGGSFIFGFFCCMMVLQLLFAWKLMPETKGIALEDMDKQVVLH